MVNSAETLTTETIIKKIEQSRNQIIRLYHSVPVTGVVEPALPNGWSVKDLLACMAAWEWRCAEILEESHSSNVPLLAEPDVAALNREFYEERQDWGWEEVEQDFRAAHKELLNVIQDLPPERLTDEAVQRTIALDTWQEYDKYLPMLQQWHKRLTSNVVQRRW